MYQKTYAIGRISDPETRENRNGNMFVRFGLAVQEKKDDDPTWLNCILGGRFAEVMSDRLAKGQLIFVEGRLSVRKGKDNEGVERTYTNLMVDTARILRDPSDAGNGRREEEQEDYDDDIPF